MNSELEQNLVANYPDIFADYRNENSQLYWGIQCGDGWYELIDLLCWCVQSHIDSNKHRNIRQPKASVIKEKFGELRFGMIGTDEYTEGMLRYVEVISGRTCDVCGGRGRIEIDKAGVARARCMRHIID